MLRIGFGVIVGFVVWMLIGTAGFQLLRVNWPDYAAGEPAFAFTLSMHLARLGVGAACSVIAGWAAVIMAKRNMTSAWTLGIVLLLMMLPVHYNLWQKFPLWYHLFFLLTLVPLIGLGGHLARGRSETPNAPA